MMKAMVFGMNCRRIIIFLALFYQPQAYRLMGQRHKRDLQEHKRAVYITLLTSGKLNCYLTDIDEQAMKMIFRLVKQMADKEGVTEQLKVEKPMLWVGRMNEIQARAREIVYADIIYK